MMDDFDFFWSVAEQNESIFSKNIDFMTLKIDVTKVAVLVTPSFPQWFFPSFLIFYLLHFSISSIHSFLF